jgi:hypothetical protein
MPVWLMLCLYYYSLSAMHAYKRNLIFHNKILMPYPVLFSIYLVIFLRVNVHYIQCTLFILVDIPLLGGLLIRILQLHLGKFLPGPKEVC